MNKPLLIKSLITASVLLNVLFIGALGGMVYKRYDYQQERRDLMQALSPESKHLMARTMQTNREKVKGIKQSAKRLQNQLVEILKSETLDEAALNQTIEKLSAAQSQAAALKLETTRTLALELSAQERKNLAKRLASTFDHKNKRHERRMKRGERFTQQGASE